MANKELVDYIQKYHEKGYSVQTLRDFLINQGYTERDVDEAISSSVVTEHKDHKTMYIIFGVIAVLLVLSALAYLTLPVFKPKTYTLSVSVLPSPSTDKLKGKEFTFLVRMTNLGTATNYPVSISYAVTKDGALVESNQKSTTSETSELSFSFIPSETGNYEIDFEIAYNEKKESPKLMFNIFPVCGDNICEEGENLSCTKDCPQNVSVCGNNICEEGENITCVNDCRPINLCGNNNCDAGENITCPGDCPKPSLCGNSVCDIEEDFVTCPADCPKPVCGNRICEQTENNVNCAQDCTGVDINKLTEYELGIYIPDRVQKAGAPSAAQECNTILNARSKDVCFTNVMRASKDALYCKYITDKNRKDECIVSYSFSTNDYSLCKEVQDRYKREVCDSSAKSYAVSI